MPEGNLLTDEFAQKVNDLMREFSRDALDLPDAQVVARALYKKGFALVDITKQRAWIDERVHSGVLFRLRSAELRARASAHLIVNAETWRGLRI